MEMAPFQVTLQFDSLSGAPPVIPVLSLWATFRERRRDLKPILLSYM